jgi:hypothetical protein
MARATPAELSRTLSPRYDAGMALTLATMAFVALDLAIVGFVVLFLHRALRPNAIRARSATALRELEPRGGRHRFHTRTFEQMLLAGATMVGSGVLLIVAATPGRLSGLIACGAGALACSAWWAWRRGVLRDMETHPRG